jgi:FkbM family methyltransferase
MPIKIGDKYGKIYDNILNNINYYKFHIKTGIKFINRLPSETFNKRMYEQIPLFIPKENEVIYDIGAYIGDYSLIWEKVYKAKVYAFECNLVNYSECATNLHFNNSKIDLYDYCIGNGFKSNMYYNGDMNNLLELSNNKTQKVYDTIKLDNFINGNIVDKPDIIKIDIEGSEYYALQGMINTLKEFKPKIIIETHSKGLFNQCNEFLLDLDYKLYATLNKRINNGYEISENYYWVK